MEKALELEVGTDVLLLEDGDTLLLEAYYTYGGESATADIRLGQILKTSVNVERWRW